MEASILDSGSIVYEFEEAINLDEDVEGDKNTSEVRRKSIVLEQTGSEIDEEKIEIESVKILTFIKFFYFFSLIRKILKKKRDFQGKGLY